MELTQTNPLNSYSNNSVSECNSKESTSSIKNGAFGSIIHENAKEKNQISNSLEKTTVFKANCDNQDSCLVSLIKKNVSAVSDFFQRPSTKFIFKAYSKKIQNQEEIVNIRQEEASKGLLEVQREDLLGKINDAKIKKESNKIEELNGKLKVIDCKIRRKEKNLLWERRIYEAREQMYILGGENITIQTPDEIHLDAIYLDAKKFRGVLKDAGASLVTYRLYSDTDHAVKLTGISLPKSHWETSGKQVFEALKLSGGIAGDPGQNGVHPGAGWTAVKDGENILLVRSEEVPSSLEDSKQDIFNYDVENKMWALNGQKKQEEEIQQIDTESDATGTVILSSCAKYIYEKNNDEALSYLFRNMNVMSYNFRGNGRSEGVPSEEGLKSDLESVYQCAKAKSRHEDKQILFKAICLNGGPAAYTSSNHPETNLFLDQSYSNLRKMSVNVIKVEIKKALFSLFDNPEQTSLMANLIRYLAAMISYIAIPILNVVIPDYKTAAYLSSINGFKALLFTRDDEYIELEEVKNNIQSIAKDAGLEKTLLFSVPGEHGESLLYIQGSPIDGLNKNISQQVKHLLDEKNSVMKKIGKTEKEIEFKNKLFESMVETVQAKKKSIDSSIEQLKKGSSEEKDKEIERLENEIKLHDSNFEEDKVWLENHLLPYKQEIARYNEQIKKIDNELIQILPADTDIEALTVKRRTAQLQVSHFLKRAGLSSDIIPLAK